MTQTLRVSVTDIDALRYYLAQEDAELSGLLAQLRREKPPTPAMKAGSALHAALEMCEPGEHGELTADGYVFEMRAEGDIDLPTVREIKATKEYAIDGVTVTLVGKVDAIHGKRIDDHKLTSRYDAERFLSSYQWRCYLDIFDADEFRWNVFEGVPDRNDPRRYTIKAIHQLRMHRYPGMGADVEGELTRFVDFARQNLPERIEMEAA